MVLQKRKNIRKIIEIKRKIREIEEELTNLTLTSEAELNVLGYVDCYIEEQIQELYDYYYEKFRSEKE